MDKKRTRTSKAAKAKRLSVKIKKEKQKPAKKSLKKKSPRAKTKKKTVEARRVGNLSFRLTKPPEGLIIEPKAENEWEAWQTFNPGAILLNNKINFLYRAIGSDGISRFGYATSSDGFKIDERLIYPVYEHQPHYRQFNIYSYFSGGSFGGAEDPRIVRVENEEDLYVTYTACVNELRVALTSIKVDDFLSKNWRWKPPVLISPPGEIHKNWVIFPEKINGKYALLHSLNPEILVDYFDDLNQLDGSTFIKSCYKSEIKKDCWDGWVRGIGPPPLKTKYGWLVFYHAMSPDDFSKYKVGAMLLDLSDPTKVIARSPEPVIEPDQDYEKNGFKSGVVYASGAVVKDGTLFVYYGASDSCVAVAYADFEKFVELLANSSTLKFQKRIFRKKLFI